MADPIAADRIEITVLVDNVTDSLSSTPSFVTREWDRLRRQGMKRTMGGALCCANHGLALVVRAEIGGKSRTVLFDGGPVDYAVERNGTRLGVDFAAIEAMVLSHGHWDHAGGLPKAIEMTRAANGRVIAPSLRSPRNPHQAACHCVPPRNPPGRHQTTRCGICRRSQRAPPKRGHDWRSTARRPWCASSPGVAGGSIHASQSSAPRKDYR
ncbi:MAG: MBL fold metallo-hydrolase [Alphaproteobacteria bacterium]